MRLNFLTLFFLLASNCVLFAQSTNQNTVKQVTPISTISDDIQIEGLTSTVPVFEVSDSLAICEGTTVELGDPGNDQTNSYIWTSDPSGFFSTSHNPTATPLVNTTYYVLVTNASCPIASSDSVFVEVDTMPVLAVINDTTVCQGEMLVLGETVAQPGMTYSWSPVTGLDDPNVANPTLTANATETYILTAANGGCESMDTVTVTVSTISIEILNTPDSTTICKGEAVSLIANVQPSGAMVNWTTDNNSFTGSGNPVIVTPETITTYYASVSVPGCEKTDTFTIDVDSLPSQLNLMPADTAVCLGSLVVIATPAYLPSDFPFIEHNWTPLLGQQTPDSLFNLAIQAFEPTWYVRETTNGVCTSLDSAFVDILPTTTMTIDPVSPVICNGDSVQLVVSSPDITEFTWTTETNITCLECPNPIVFPEATTVYEVEGEFLGCPVMAQVNVVVDNPASNGIIADDDFCEGQSIELNPTPDLSNTYVWTSDPPGFNSTNANPMVSPTEITTYFVTIDNGSVCPPVMDEVTIEPIGSNVSVEVGTDATVCLEVLAFDQEEIPLFAAGNSTGGTYTWLPIENAPPVIGSGSNVTVLPNATGVFDYEVTFTNNCGFSISDMVTLTIVPTVDIVEIIIMPEDTVGQYNEGQELFFTAITNPPNPSNVIYNWTEAGIQIGEDSPQFMLIANQSTSIFVSVTTADGCADGAFIPFEVQPAIWTIPNAFTPDADGLNDRFRLITRGAITIKSFQIFDRWGEKVFDDISPSGWNGMYKDKPMPADVYIYNVVFERPGTGEEKTLTGDVTLVR